MPQYTLLVLISESNGQRRVSPRVLLLKFSSSSWDLKSIMKYSRVLISLFLLWTIALAVDTSALSCTTFHSHEPGSNSNRYVIQLSVRTQTVTQALLLLTLQAYFPGGSNLVANVTASTPLHTAGSKAPPPTSYGNALDFYACNSTSLNLMSSTTTGCGDEVCTRHYYDYVQGVNPVTGHCMMWDHPETPSNISFKACDKALTTYAQPWSMEQDIDLGSKGTAPTGYTTPYILQLAIAADIGNNWYFTLEQGHRTVIASQFSPDPKPTKTDAILELA